MKQTIITILLALVAVSACTQQDNYTISGELSCFVGVLVEDISDIDSVCLVNKANIQQKSAIKDGKFFFTGHVDVPQYSELKIPFHNEQSTDTATLSFILEAGDIVYADGSVKGSVMTDSFVEKRKEIWQLCGEGKDDEAKCLYLEQIEQHRDDAISVALLLTLHPDWMTATEEKKLLISLGDEVKSDFRVQKKLERLMKLQPSDVGDMFLDFEVEYDGKATRLSDYVGKGKYVLVDFWASWCGPCREEIPNLIAAYNKYKEKGLVVLGVAVSDKPEATMQAIKELNIPYPQILNSQKIATDLYGIDGIPEIMLFAPDGTILKRGLRGEVIEKKLEEIFKVK